MLFKSIIGQNELKNKILHQTSTNKLGHATLFAGNHGYGGLPLALALAQLINCESPTNEDSCGVCASCKKMEKLIHPDVHFSFPVATTDKVKSKPQSSHFLSEWREALLDNPYLSFAQWFEVLNVDKKQGNIAAEESHTILKHAALKSYEGNFKVFIIWMAEKMNASAANKLLKIIEEPPPKTAFILVAEETEAILPTILSRVQLFKVKRIEDDAIASNLRLLNAQTEGISKIVHLAEGSWSSARMLVGMDTKEDFYFERFSEWARMCFKVQVPDIIQWVDQMAALGREKQKVYFNFSLSILRESLLHNYKTTELSRVVGKEADFKKNFAPFIHEGNALEIIDEISKASYHIERNGNPKTIFLDLSLKVIKLLKIKSVTL